jgi:hypothetical protein
VNDLRKVITVHPTVAAHKDRLAKALTDLGTNTPRCTSNFLHQELAVHFTL